MVDENAIQPLVKQARDNPAIFMWFMSGKAPAQHHVRWLKEMLNPDQKRILIIAPRESAKTTISVYYLAWWIGHFPFSTNAILSVSAEQASDRLNMVKTIIDSDLYRTVFPDVQLDARRKANHYEFSIWLTKDRKTGKALTYSGFKSLLASNGSLKDPTVYASGITAKRIIGRRFSGIVIVDDPHDQINSATMEHCDRVETYFNAYVLGGMQSSGKVIVITTRWSSFDLAGRLKEKKALNGSPIWRTIETPALDEEGKSYWEEYWSVERLAQKREEIGEMMWQTMYMNNPIGASSMLFRREHLVNDVPKELPELSALVVSCDIAETSKANSDWTVVAAVARDAKKPYNVYILDMIRFKGSFHVVIEQIARFCDRVYDNYYRLDAVLFEIPYSHPHLQALREQRPDLPCQGVHPKGSKADRLSLLAGRAHQNALYINQNMPDLFALISELIGFPKESHDDICDALSLPFQWDRWVRSYGSAGYTTVKSPYLI